MEPTVFNNRMIDAFELDLHQRHAALLRLHRRLLDDFEEAVMKIDDDRAAQSVNMGEDTRTLSQVVAHIGDWSRYEIMGAADILTGLNHPRGVVKLTGYVSNAGREMPFSSVVELNAHQAEVHAGLTWEQARTFALDKMQALYQLFATPRLLTSDRLETTGDHLRHFGDHTRVFMKEGWVLWAMELEHIGVQHREELGLP